jgi:hypothetical protein
MTGLSHFYALKFKAAPDQLKSFQRPIMNVGLHSKLAGCVCLSRGAKSAHITVAGRERAACRTLSVIRWNISEEDSQVRQTFSAIWQRTTSC